MSDPRNREALWAARGVLEDLMSRGVDDYVGMDVLVSVAKRFVQHDESVQFCALGLASHIFLHGLAEPGSVRDGRFVRWDGDSDAWLRKLSARLQEEDLDQLTPGIIGRLRITEDGEAIGRAVREREADAL